jgi:4-hydroxy-tetrahydrodipicolinate synthase
VGGVGVISVASNLIPHKIAGLVNAMGEGRLSEAQAIHRDCYRLFHAFLKLDTNPVPIKTALALAGKCNGDVRLPLVGMPDEKRDQLATILRDLGILN